jgi:hypothetical protein
MQFVAFTKRTFLIVSFLGILAGFVALVGTIHQQAELFRHRAQLREQRPTLRRVVGVARR